MAVMTTSPMPVPPETRNWLSVLDGGCDECGWQPLEATDVADTLESAMPRWRRVLHREGASARPAETVWSPVEYACHVRDMVWLLGLRTRAMLDQADPQFENWDGDQKSVELDYFSVPPSRIADDLGRRTDETAAVLRTVTGAQWDRPGHRSDGTRFTVASLAQFMSHEVAHHLKDVHG